jgi:hypothetical protein
VHKPNLFGIIVFMQTTTQTTTGRKIAKRYSAKAATPPKNKRAYSRKELAAEVFRLCKEVHDPAYLADVASGSRKNERLAETVARAVRNLETRAQHGTQDKTV